MLRRQLKILAVLSLAFPILFAGVLLMTNADPSVRASGGNEPAGRKGWRLADGVTYENLTIFPVVAAKQPDTSGFATLDEALASGAAVVTEQGNYLRRTRDGVMEPSPGGSAQVNQLVLVNRGKKPLILLAGEVISGGKQDRIIGKDRIIPAGALPLPLNVFCVERGRWTDVSTSFSAAKMMAHPSVREKAAIAQDQGQVWASVRGGTTYAMRTPSTSAGLGSAGGTAAAPAPAVSSSDLSNAIASIAPTESYPKMMQSGRVGASVENFAEQMQRRFERATKDLEGERVIGVVVAFGGEVAWSDVFASSELFHVYWPKLLRSYAVEAVMRPPTRENASLEDARDFIRPAVGHTKEESDAGVYRWRQIIEGRTTEIELESLAPTTLTLHLLRVTRS